jgi:hypothetical protein
MPVSILAYVLKIMRKQMLKHQHKYGMMRHLRHQDDIVSC